MPVAPTSCDNQKCLQTLPDVLGGKIALQVRTAALTEQSDFLTTAFSSSSAFRLALVQLQVSSIKSDNLTRACGLVQKAATQGAKIVSLPVSMEAAHPFWGLLAQQNSAC